MYVAIRNNHLSIFLSREITRQSAGKTFHHVSDGENPHRLYVKHL